MVRERPPKNVRAARESFLEKHLMNAPFKTWTVLPHGDLIQINDRILTVVGDLKMPLVHLPRRMTIVRLNDGGLVIYSAIALDEAQMARVEAFGTPRFMIVPSGRHRLDAPAYAARYPQLKTIAAHGARAKVAEVVNVDANAPNFGDPSVRYVEVAGTNQTEAALEVDAEDGVTLIVNEIIGDIHGAHGLGGWLLKTMGFAGDEPHVPAGPKLEFAKHKADLAAQLRQWAAIRNLKRIIVSHGDIIETDPQANLRKLADSLD